MMMVNVSTPQEYFNKDQPPGTFEFLVDGTWCCTICNCKGIQMSHIHGHRGGKKHLKSLGIYNKSAKKNRIPLSANIQETLDNLDKPLIGLEYLLEIWNTLEPINTYHCLLCNKIADSVNTLIAHLTEMVHITTFLQIHFPNAFNALGSKQYVREKVIKIASAIENRFGRMKPRVVSSTEYKNTVDRLQKQAGLFEHFNESEFPTLTDQCGSDTEEDEDPETDLQTKRRNYEKIFESASKRLKRSTSVTSNASFESGQSDCSRDSVALPDDFVVLDECIDDEISNDNTGERNLIIDETEQVANIDGGTNMEFVKTETIKPEDRESLGTALVFPRKVAVPTKLSLDVKKERKRLRKMGLRVTISIECDEWLSEEKKAIVQRCIAEKISQRPAGHEAPRFFDSFYVNKCLIVNCENYYSKRWLEEVVCELKPWKGAELYLGEYTAIKVAFEVPNIFASSPSDVILKMMEDQNCGLATQKWKVVRPHSEENELEMVVSIDDKTKAWLDTKKWTASLGLNRVTFKQFV